jgi:hypothetical protein
MRRSLQGLTVLAGCLLSLAPLAAEDPEPKIVPNLPARVIAGERAGQTLCLVRQHQFGRAVGIYARAVDGSLLKLIKEVDAKLGKHSGLGGYLIVIPENKDEEARLKGFAKEHSLQRVDIAMADQAPDEFNKQFGLPPKSALTVYCTVERKVIYQRSFEPGKLDEKALSEVMSKVSELGK